jgi:hypothetical protein
MANTDSWAFRPSAELLMVASMFEHILQRDTKVKLAEEFSALFQGYGSITVEQATQRPGIVLDKNLGGRDKKWHLHRKWLWELYHLRNKYAHGEDPDQFQWGWSLSEHLVMSAYVFPLLVKLLLVAEGIYQLTSKDKVRCRALDPLLAARNWSQEMPDSSMSVWEGVMNEAQGEEIRRRAIAALEARQSI